MVKLVFSRDRGAPQSGPVRTVDPHLFVDLDCLETCNCPTGNCARHKTLLVMEDIAHSRVSSITCEGVSPKPSLTGQTISRMLSLVKLVFKLYTKEVTCISIIETSAA